MSILSNPTQKSPERAFTLQKYLILHSQHDALQKHLNSISPPSPFSSTSSSASPTPSPSTSPTTGYRNHHRRFSTSPINELPVAPVSSMPKRPSIRKRRSSLPPTLDTANEHAVREDEQKLQNVNEQIKTTLTELLNIESVRADRRYRMWVQSRLMDAEKELRTARSRSVSSRRASVDFANFDPALSSSSGL